jgi:hypothetical protein
MNEAVERRACANSIIGLCVYHFEPASGFSLPDVEARWVPLSMMGYISTAGSELYLP